MSLSLCREKIPRVSRTHAFACMATCELDVDVYAQINMVHSSSAIALDILYIALHRGFVAKKQSNDRSLTTDRPSISSRASRVVVRTAQNFEEAKRSLGGFHFVAVQDSADSDDVAGFWLLKEVAM